MNNRALVMARSVLAVGLLAGTHVHAAEVTEKVAKLSDDASLRESAVSALSGIAFEAGEEAKTARLKWAKNDGTEAFSATLSVPVDDDAGSSTLADLDGLAKALSFAGSYTKYFTAGFTARNHRIKQGLCDRWNISSTCDNDHWSALHPAPSPAEQRAFEYAGRGQSWTPFLSFEAKAGRQKVNFFNSTTLAKSDEVDLPYALSATFGGLTAYSVWSVRAKYQRAVKEKDKVTYCTPAKADARTDDCNTLGLGAPALESSTVFSFEYRTFYKAIALSPLISYDTKSNQTGIDLPIYFLKDADGQFTGGVRLGYKSKDDKHVTASIFITKPLSL